MKAQSTGKKYIRGRAYRQAGMSTLEILIAFSILILSISAVIIVTFGNQSLAIDLETNNEAISKAQKSLESLRAKSRQNFLSVVSDSAPVPDDIYSKQNTVIDLTQCKKQATSVVSWNTGSRNLNVTLSTFLSDIAGALMMGGDCDSSPLSGWDNPISAASISIGGQGATDIDVRNNILYLTSSASAVVKEDFFIYEFNPVTETLTERSKINVGKGLTSVDVINNYAFTLNDDTSNALMVFNISDLSNPSLVASVSLPNMTIGIGRSIFYYNNFIYIGTQYLPCPSCTQEKNNELHVFDVTNPATPVWKGSFNVNHNINDIIVRGNYVYLATSDNSGEVHIYDISNPASILFIGSFDTPGDEDGQSLYLLGNKLYLGRDRTPAARKDFYILDISNPSNPTELGSKNLGLNPGSVVVGVVVKNNLAFLGLDNPTSGLQILNISDPANIVNHSVCTTLNFSENSTAIDMDEGSIFSASKSNTEIRVIRDQASVCS